MNRPWVDQTALDKAGQDYARGVIDQVDAELQISAITNEASWDAGFEAGVLASEAGVGRADE